MRRPPQNFSVSVEDFVAAENRAIQYKMQARYADDPKNSYYVYALPDPYTKLKYGYIGEGYGNRAWQCNQGGSVEPSYPIFLKEQKASKAGLNVVILFEGLTKKEAKRKQDEEIKKHQPRYNVYGTNKEGKGSCGNQKLTDADAIAIKDRYHRGEPWQTIADDYPRVTKGTVRKCAIGETHKKWNPENRTLRAIA